MVSDLNYDFHDNKFDFQYLHNISTVRNELVPTADCICPGQNFTYECTVVGEKLTVWNGTVFMPGCDITLHHNRYADDSGEFRTCNNRTVVGQTIEVVNCNSYKSNLTILVTDDLDGLTVICSADDGSPDMTIIGNRTLHITRGKARAKTEGFILTNHLLCLFTRALFIPNHYPISPS